MSLLKASFAFVCAAALWTAPLWLGACAVDDPSGRPGADRLIADRQPGELDGATRIVAAELAAVATISAGSQPLDHRLHQPRSVEPVGEVSVDSCNALRDQLWPVCEALIAAGEATSCSPTASFFYAHEMPRCALRFELYPENYEEVVPDILALDLTGTPRVGSPEQCGNGVIDEGETCDDGNRDAWDGCDPHCNQEPFNGCEAVIEAYYAEAGLAAIDQHAWDGPRSHLMVHERAEALQPVTEATCNAALATATDVCNELSYAMPFVGWCWPSGELHQDDEGAACSVRLHVGFQSLDPASGVYTTGLPGLLAFTIR